MALWASSPQPQPKPSKNKNSKQDNRHQWKNEKVILVVSFSFDLLLFSEHNSWRVGISAKLTIPKLAQKAGCHQKGKIVLNLLKLDFSVSTPSCCDHLDTKKHIPLKTLFLQWFSAFKNTFSKVSQNLILGKPNFFASFLKSHFTNLADYYLQKPNQSTKH